MTVCVSSSARRRRRTRVVAARWTCLHSLAVKGVFLAAPRRTDEGAEEAEHAVEGTLPQEGADEVANSGTVVVPVEAAASPKSAEEHANFPATRDEGSPPAGGAAANSQSAGITSAGTDVVPGGLAARALGLIKLGRFEEALADTRRCVDLRPDSPIGYVHGAIVLRALGRPQEALELLHKAPGHDEVKRLTALLRQEASEAHNNQVDDNEDDGALKEAKDAEPAAKLQCGICAKVTTKAFRCGACKQVVYCSPTCQRTDWGVHRQRCQALSAAHSADVLAEKVPVGIVSSKQQEAADAVHHAEARNAISAAIASSRAPLGSIDRKIDLADAFQGAAYNGLILEAEILLKEGASVNWPDSMGMSPLQSAFCNGQRRMAKFLADRGGKCRPDEAGWRRETWKIVKWPHDIGF